MEDTFEDTTVYKSTEGLSRRSDYTAKPDYDVRENYLDRSVNEVKVFSYENWLENINKIKEIFSYATNHNILGHGFDSSRNRIYIASCMLNNTPYFYGVFSLQKGFGFFRNELRIISIKDSFDDILTRAHEFWKNGCSPNVCLITNEAKDSFYLPAYERYKNPFRSIV